MKAFLSLFTATLLLCQSSVLGSAIGKAHDLEARSEDHYPERCSKACPVPWLRAFLPNTDHFYTTSISEMVQAIKSYHLEGYAAHIFATQVNFTVPLYRLYNGVGVDHFYTTSAAERDNAIAKLGYSDEGITGFVYPSQKCSGVPLFRLYNPKIVDHFYTTGAAERDNAAANLGYTYEGIACYVLPP